MNLLAIGWEPELRGLLTVVIAVVILMGSVYLIMMTNMGSRLAFLVALAGLAGWMMLMGATWWIYGIGLRGPDPTWQPVPGATVLQETSALRSAGVLDELPDIPDDATPARRNQVHGALPWRTDAGHRARGVVGLQRVQGGHDRAVIGRTALVRAPSDRTSGM